MQDKLAIANRNEIIERSFGTVDGTENLTGGSAPVRQQRHSESDEKRKGSSGVTPLQHSHP
jgi:hypothetical protein